MQSKNALSNLKNRYVAVLKKCALLNVFGTLAVATMCAMPATAFSATNPAGSTISGMEATAVDPTLENYGTIAGAITNSDRYYGMFGNSASQNFKFSNFGTISLNVESGIHPIIGLSLSAMGASGDGNHILNNYGTINATAKTITSLSGFMANVYGINIEAKGNQIANNFGTINIKAIGGQKENSYVNANASGILILGDGNHTANNNGTINATAIGGTTSNVVIPNMSANALARGIQVSGKGDHTLTNNGTINATAIAGTTSGTTRPADADANARGIVSVDTGYHTLNNYGIINVEAKGGRVPAGFASANANAYGMYLSLNTATVNNFGIINTNASVQTTGATTNAFEAYGAANYSVGTWATTLRTWAVNDAVFGGGTGYDLTFQNSTLILRPGTKAQGFEFGKEYAVANTNGMAAGIQGAVNGTILQATTEVPFLKATLKNGNNPTTATLRLDTNINTDTTPGSVSAQGNLALVQGQMSNITRKLLQTKYTEIYADLVSDNANSGIAAGSEAEQNKWTAFLTPYGSLTNNSKYNFDGSQMGVTGGASYNFSEKFSLGGHFDFNYAEFDADIMNMQSDSSSYALGLHANYKIMPQWYVSAQATGSISQIENEYSLNAGILKSKADYDSQAIYFALNSGYVFEVAKGHTFTPQVGLSYLNMYADSYDIDWGAYSMYNMQYDSTSYSAFYADLALNWHSVWQFENNHALALLASVGVRQNLSGSDIDSDFRVFGTEYSTRSNADDTTFLADLGLEWSKDNFSLSLNYNGEYGSSQQVHGVNATFKYLF